MVPPGETDPTSTVGSNLFGVYGELGYNVLYYVDTDMALVPFVRVDYQVRLPVRAPINRRDREPVERRHGLYVLAGLPALVVVGFAMAATSAPASCPIVGDPCVR